MAMLVVLTGVMMMTVTMTTMMMTAAPTMMMMMMMMMGGGLSIPIIHLRSHAGTVIRELPTMLLANLEHDWFRINRFFFLPCGQL
jgi:predicted transglutaminase-like cysteine proteinase